MAFGRRTRSLARTATQTAVITGTAVATSNAMNSRSARRAQATAPAAAAAPAVAPGGAPEEGAHAIIRVTVAAAAASDDPIARLERVLALHAAGALTDAEFDALKAIAIR